MGVVPPYHGSVRRIIVHQHLTLRLPMQEVRRLTNTFVCDRSIRRWKANIRLHGDSTRPAALCRKRGRRFRVSPERRLQLASLVLRKPTRYLDEIQKAFFFETGLCLPLSLVDLEVRRRLRLTMKVARRVHSKQDARSRAIFGQCMVLLDLFKVFSRTRPA
jgi:hypothetical protein